MSAQNYFTPPAEYTANEANAMPELSSLGQDVLVLVEQTWWTRNILLTPENVGKYVQLTDEEAESIWKEPAFQHALRVKGIVSDRRYSGTLTAKQMLVANMVLTRQDTRSLREKLKEAGANVSQWNAWMADRDFAEYVQKKSGVDFTNADHLLKHTLLNGMEKGDLAATKLYAEIRGLTNRKVEVELNVNMLLQQVVEVLQEFIPEDKLLEAAAAVERIYGIHSGQKVAALDAIEAVAPAVLPDI